ncbi:MAG: hypothetical protein HYZ42_12120, partial [Bacteroidetes bacterium]|nr:hypothetical protein [Bacteroidota bacterium]
MIKIIFTWALFCLSEMVMACDMCGFSSLSYNGGSLPQIQKSFIGFRYSQVQSSSESISIVPYLHTKKNKYITSISEVFGRWSVNNKIQLMTYIPLVKNTVEVDNVVGKIYGFGDLSFVANYIITKSSKWQKNILMLNAGVKLPTGKFQKNPNDDLQNLSLQLGTGSVDFPIGISFVHRIRNISIQGEASYRFNS